MIKLNNKSIYKSRLRITKPAFMQLVQQGLKMAAGFKTNVKGFDILIHSIVMNDSSLNDEGVNQDLLLNLSIEKAQGWMPFQADTQLQVNWTWSITHQDGYPAMRIEHLVVASDKKTKVDLLKFNFAIPNFIEKKIFGELEERIPQIEQAANQQIRKACNKIFSRTYNLPLPDRSPKDSPQIKFEKWLWDASLDQQDLIIDLNLEAQTAWLDTNFSVFQFHVNHKDLPVDMNSIIRLPIPFRELYDQSQHVQIPLGKLGRSNINAMHIQVITMDKAGMELTLSGDVHALIKFEVQIIQGSIPRFQISNFDLSLDNKLLDFGASLFEHKIESALQIEIDKLLTNQVGKLIERGNYNLMNMKPYLFMRDRRLSIDDIMINVEFGNESLLITLQSEYFSKINIKGIPEGLIP